jgi:hypothetical protein
MSYVLINRSGSSATHHIGRSSQVLKGDIGRLAPAVVLHQQSTQASQGSPIPTVRDAIGRMTAFPDSARSLVY